MRKQLTCVVEGHGEVAAVPVLCNRVFRELLDVHDWYVDNDPIKLPRGELVDARSKGPGRSVRRGLELVVGRRASGALIVCDVDDDCPVIWSRGVAEMSVADNRYPPIAAVMCCREFESWILHGVARSFPAAKGLADPDRSPRDAKGKLAEVLGRYRPTLDQLNLTRELDLAEVWRRSKSFDKFVRSLAAIANADLPSRPT